MEGVFQYLQWRGDLSFLQDPPNEVDALIFSALSYVSYGDSVRNNPDDPVLLQYAAQEFLSGTDLENRVRVKRDIELLKAASETRRFGTCKLCRYQDMLIPEQETQFAAVSFLLDDGSAFIAFRGTDYSLVGWKEDFNMSFQQTVPAQRLALQYTRDFATQYLLPLRLGGHSKGGNLAVFAAARSSPTIQARILQVYNNDGPGFTEYLIGDPGYLTMVPRIKTFVPQSSVIGMLLEHEEPYKIIKSTQVSLLQHEIYSWEVIGKHFVQMEEITSDSRFLNQTIKNWIADLSIRERNVLVDTLFDLLACGDVDSALDIFHPKNIRKYIKTVNKNTEMKTMFSKELRNILVAAKKARAQFEDPPRMDL